MYKIVLEVHFTVIEHKLRKFSRC